MKVRVVGTPHEADVAPGASMPPGVRAVRDGNVVWVHAHGETYRVEAVLARRGAAASEAEHDLVAPMPGKVTKVLVEEGQDVGKGAPLLVLEAMKMEHSIKAPRDGKVARLFRKAGEMVAMGEKLVELV